MKIRFEFTAELPKGLARKHVNHYVRQIKRGLNGLYVVGHKAGIDEVEIDFKNVKRKAK